MKAGIGLDDWKLPVFRKGLEDAGYDYVDAGAFTYGTTILHVEYADEADRQKLQAVIQECNDKCAKLKRRG